MMTTMTRSLLLSALVLLGGSAAASVQAIPKIGDHETVIVMHNDAVVQGLSEVPSMRDYEHWGVLTIGTGLGNARFTNRRSEDEEKEEDEDEEEEEESEDDK